MFLLIILCMPLFAGPFGLEMGMSLEKIKEISEVDPIGKGDDVYIITPPKPHDLFELYLIKINIDTGLYYLKAASKDIETSSYGTELKSTFMSLVSSIEKTYGKYKLVDYLKYKSIWDEPGDFMMGMIKKERSLIAFWDKEESSTLTDDLVQIAIAAYPLSTNKGYILLQYTFKNYEEADKKLKEEKDSVF
jgi:hypothetical protein